MAKWIAAILISIVSGLLCFFGSLFFLTNLGLERYDNYEYYGQYPLLFCVPGVVGFAIPLVVTWAWGKFISKSRSSDSE
jgi:hypothetical protein